MKAFASSLLPFAVFFALVADLYGQLPTPRLDRIAPLGGAAGSTVEVDVLGGNFEEVRRLVFDHPGLSAEHLKDRRFRIRIDPAVPEGSYDVRAVGTWGLSNPRLFAVQSQFPETSEKEPNDSADTAQEIVVNQVINAASDGNKDDWFRVRLHARQRVWIDCFGQRLESPLDAVMIVTDANGKQLAAASDSFGRDPAIDFVPPSAGEYRIRITDLTYRGGLPYRLVVSDRPQVEVLWPNVVAAGKPAAVTAFGRNLGAGARPSSRSCNELPMDEKELSIPIPADILKFGEYRFRSHPVAHSVVSTAATATLVGIQSNPHLPPLVVTDLPIILESEPNDDRNAPQHLTLPTVVACRFDQPRDQDWFEFTPPTDGRYDIEVSCERIAGQADPFLVLLDEKENRLAEEDDFGIRFNAFDGHIRDPRLSIELKAKSRYRLLVQDRYRRGGLRYRYALSLRPSVPDFFPALIHHENPGPAGFNILKGGAYHCDVIIHSSGGLNETITLHVEGLPKGIHARPSAITNSPFGTLVLWADADAPDFIGPIRVIATAEQDGRRIQRLVRPYTRPGNSDGLGGSRPMRDLMICVQRLSPIGLRCDQERIEVEAGQKVDLPIRLTRFDPDAKGAFTLIGNSPFGNLKITPGRIAEGQSQGTVGLTTAGGTKPGEYSISVIGQGQVPIEKEAGKAKQNVLISQSSPPVTIVVRPAQKK